MLFLSLMFFSFVLTGVLRVWDSSTARCVYIQALPSTLTPASDGGEEKEDNPRSLTYLLHLPASFRLATVTAEHNILLYQLPALTTQQQVMFNFHVWHMKSSKHCHLRGDAFLIFQFVGYNDEVLDVKFLGKADSHIVVATNSCQLKVFELQTNSCQILYGHTG